MLRRTTLVIALVASSTGCSAWQALWRKPPAETRSELRFVPNPPPEPPPVQHEASLSGDMLYVARLVLLDWWPPEMMPTQEAGPASRCAMSPENYRMDIREDKDRYVVKIAFIQQWRCGIFVDTDATYEVSKDKLEIISKMPQE